MKKKDLRAKKNKIVNLHQKGLKLGKISFKN